MATNKLLKSAKIICPSSSFHNKTKDILIENGVITKIEDSISVTNAEEFKFENLHVSIGWMDLKANFREPGEEWKETLKSGAKAATKSGFTNIALSPATKQPIDSKNRVDYLTNIAKDLTIKITPVGTLSDQHLGKELSEMYEMSQAGAVAFTDDKQNVNVGLLSKALLYTKPLNKKIISFANEIELSKKGQIHEGEISTKMGLVGIPSLAEEMRITRDLALAEYHETSIHFSTISTKKSVELIRIAKQKGIKVTCDIAAHQLFFTDKNAVDYDSNFKTNPPFRTQSDINELITGLKDGTIDAICSDHSPLDTEDKKLEFDQAEFGIIGLESFFGSLNTVLKDNLTLEQIIAKITVNPRNILGVNLPKIEINEPAELTLFSPTEKWIFTKNDIYSLSKNTPFIGEEFIGKSFGIIS